MKNKYILTLLIFIVWIILLDPNNLISLETVKNRNRLQQEKEYYMSRIEEDRRKLNELRTNNENLEKYAREQYRMKRADEDPSLLLRPSRKERSGVNGKVSQTPKPAGRQASEKSKKK